MNAVVARLAGAGVLALLVVATAVAMAVNPLLAALPVIVVVLAWGVWRMPVRTSALALLALTLLAHSEQDKPADGLWVSPLEWLGLLLFKNLSAITGIGALAFSVLDACLVLLVAACLARRGTSEDRLNEAGPVPGAAIIFGTTLVALLFYGLATGGEGDPAYWQLRQLLYIPAFTLLFAFSLHGEQDTRALGKIVVWTALAKAAVGLFFFFGVVKARGLHPDYVTTHSDSMHFVLAVLVLFTRWLEEPRRQHLRRLLFFVPPIFMAMLLNDRRLAWVGLVSAAAVAFIRGGTGAMRRQLMRVAILSLPLVAVYVAVGWSSHSRVFAPVATLRSMVEANEDASTRSREIENYNLSRTLAAAPIFGQGFGHEYVEVVKGPDVARAFSLYRFIPHNSVLWLLSVGGLVGFALLLQFFGVGVYLAARAHRSGSAPELRAASSVCLGAVLVFLVQCFGDMGTQSWTTVSLLAVSVAVAGKLAVQAQAYPALTVSHSLATVEQTT